MYHRMWGAAAHDRSTGVHRPLTATVLALRPLDEASSDGFVIISLDHCIIGDEDLANIRRLVAQSSSFPAESIHITLSHTHGSGLMTRDRTHLPGGELIPFYLEDMARRVAGLAAEAEASLDPAWIVYGAGRCDLAANRDYFDAARGGYVCGFNPAHPADDTVLVARISDRRGSSVATLVNYACHPTTLAWENTLISPDYIGAMRETVQSATGGAPCLFLQGASGELGPREGFVGDPAVADRNGRRLGYAALAAIEALPPPATQFVYRGAVVSGALLGTWAHQAATEDQQEKAAAWKTRSWTIDLPFRSDLPSLEQTRSERQSLIAKEQAAEASGDVPAARELRARVEQMTRQIMRLEALPPSPAFPLNISLLRTGDACWVLVAGEHYSYLQTTLRARFPERPIVVCTITDGWQPGYLPTADTYGKGIYQEQIAMVEPGALERVVEEIEGQIIAFEKD